ncbi:MAG: hypothetical protein ACI9A7_002313 [Cyclobacteriaceae bacterium]|jgi:hypothetical protein
MKKTTQLLTTLVFLSLSIFISCGGSDPVDIDTRDAQGVLASGTFNENGVSVDGGTREEWEGFSITMSYNVDTDQGTFSSSGAPTNDGAADVWPSSGTWTFGGAAGAPDVTTIMRSDGVEMTAGISATALTLGFTIPDAGGRTFDGDWSFAFNK